MLCFTFFQTQKRFLSYEAFILKHVNLLKRIFLSFNDMPTSSSFYDIPVSILFYDIPVSSLFYDMPLNSF